ncbi:1014_t:CDS:2, partial [Dentiscutata heterogama]
KLPLKLYDEICAIISNNYMENNNMGIEFSCLLELDTINDPHKLSKKIAELVKQEDGYNYIYKKSYDLKKVLESHSFWYYCSQCQTLNKRSQKYKDLEQQRDHERFEVDNVVQEHIKKYIYLISSDIYKQLESNYPDFMQKQLNSMKILLKEYNYSIVLENIMEGIKYLGFITPFFNLLLKNKEIVVDTTYQTNALDFELYLIIEQFDGARFTMVYLFIDSKKKDNGALSQSQSFQENTNSIFNIEQDKENQPNVIVNIESIEKLENYENSDDNDSDDLYENYELYLTKALEIVQEQKAKQNYKWAKSVKSSFAGLQKMVTDIETYKRRTTNPQTWKDHNRHTLFF